MELKNKKQFRVSCINHYIILLNIFSRIDKFHHNINEVGFIVGPGDYHDAGHGRYEASVVAKGDVGALRGGLKEDDIEVGS